MSNRFETHGDFSWSELQTKDAEVAKQFYCALFGWEAEDMPMEGGGTYTCMKAGETAVGGIMSMPPNIPEGTPPHWGCYVTVDDVDATAKKVEELGGQICVPPTDIPKVGRFCVFQDNQGAFLSAITYSMEECDE